MVQPFGDDFPIKTMMNQASGEQGSVVIKFTQIYHNIYIYIHTYISYIYIYICTYRWFSPWQFAASRHRPHASPSVLCPTDGFPGAAMGAQWWVEKWGLLGVSWNGESSKMVYWLVVSTYPSEKYEVSWDDDIPNWMESHKIPWFQTTNQIQSEHIVGLYNITNITRGYLAMGTNVKTHELPGSHKILATPWNPEISFVAMGQVLLKSLNQPLNQPLLMVNGQPLLMVTLW